MANELNAMQRAFVNNYTGDELMNGTKSAIKAGYSEKTAHVQASRLLRNVKVKAEINRILELQSLGKGERLGILTNIASNEEETTSDRLRAIENLGKIAGDYTEKIEEKSDRTIRFVWASDD